MPDTPYTLAQRRFERLTPSQQKGVAARTLLSRLADTERAFVKAVHDEVRKRPLVAHYAH